MALPANVDPFIKGKLANMYADGRGVEKNDATAQLEIGTFLALFPKVSPQLLSSRLDRAGEKFYSVGRIVKGERKVMYS